MALNNYLSREYVDNLVSTIGLSFKEQTHTAGATITIDNLTTILYVNPVSILSNLTITLAANPVNGQETKISFGGAITFDGVVSNLSIVGNAGHTILAGSNIINASAGDGYILKFESVNNLWRIF